MAHGLPTSWERRGGWGSGVRGGPGESLDAGGLDGVEVVADLEEVAHGGELLVGEPGQLWDLIDGLAAGGTTVLLTTQYLEEADRLAAQVVVIDHGHVVAEGSPAELKERSGGQVIEARPANHADVAAVTRVLSAVAGVPAVPERDTVAVPAADPALLGAAVSRLAAERITVSQIGLRLPSLDEAFLRLTAGSGAGNAAGSTVGSTVGSGQ